MSYLPAMKFITVTILGTSLLKRKNIEPLNLGGLTKSAAAMMAAKHASALKASANEIGDGDVEVVGVVSGNASKLISMPQGDKSEINFLNKLTQLPASVDGKGNITTSASSALARAAVIQMAGSGMEDIGSTSALNFGNLQSGYSTLGESNNSYTNLMSAAAARDPYYQALLASGLGGNSGNSTASGGNANTVDLLQKCK